MSLIHTNIIFLRESKVSENLSDLIKEVLQANLPPSLVSKFPFSLSLCISREEKVLKIKAFVQQVERKDEKCLVKSNTYQVYTEKNPTPEHFLLFIRKITNKVTPNKNIYSNLQFFKSVI